MVCVILIFKNENLVKLAELGEKEEDIHQKMESIKYNYYIIRYANFR